MLHVLAIPPAVAFNNIPAVFILLYFTPEKVAIPFVAETVSVPIKSGSAATSKLAGVPESQEVYALISTSAVFPLRASSQTLTTG